MKQSPDKEGNMEHLTIQQASEQTGIAESTIAYNIRAGYLPATRFGDGSKAPYAISPADLDAWVARRQGRNQTPPRPGLITLAEAARQLRLTPAGLHWRIQEGHIDAVRYKRWWYLTEQTIQGELGSN
jgi:excisionase family DNA binding protein